MEGFCPRCLQLLEGLIFGSFSVCAGKGGEQCGVVFLMTNKHLCKRTTGRMVNCRFNEDMVKCRIIQEDFARALYTRRDRITQTFPVVVMFTVLGVALLAVGSLTKNIFVI